MTLFYLKESQTISDNTYDHYFSFNHVKDLIKNPASFAPLAGESVYKHSKNLDKAIGYQISRLEQKLLKKYRAFYKVTDSSNPKKHFENTQTWIGLHPQVLLTPYSEIYHFLSLFKNFNPKKIIDLGAAYGRVGIVMNAIYPDATFIGYEIVDIRINEARRIFKHFNYANCSMIKQDILENSFNIPPASIYFIYDFSFPDDLKVILKKLSSLIKTSDRFFIVAKGESIQAIIRTKFPEFSIHQHISDGKKWSIFSSM